MEKGDDVLTTFHRIIMPSVLSDFRLVLPKMFVERYGFELSNTIKLLLPIGVVWYIGLKPSGNLLYLCVGWEEFMNHYSIRFGYFLIFKYKKNSEFDVHIFDLTTREIQYPLGCKSNMSNRHSECTKRGKRSYTDVKEEEDEDDDHTKIITPRKKPKAIFTVSDQALAAAEMYKTENPFCIVKLKHYNVNKSQLYMPRAFSREHLNDCSESIELVDCCNMKWVVGLNKYHPDVMLLMRGWQQFVKGNGLNSGDVCVFELIAKSVLKVSVFHS